MIKIKTDKEIENDSVELFDNLGNKIGNIESTLQLQDVCVQIKKENTNGYYVIFKGTKNIIENNGRLYFGNNRPFTALGSMLCELI